MSAIHTIITTTAVTYLQPPPAGTVSTVIPNESRENVITVNSSEVDNPGSIPLPVASTFIRIADPWTVNPNLTQYFPVNAPPTP